MPLGVNSCYQRCYCYSHAFVGVSNEHPSQHVQTCLRTTYQYKSILNYITVYKPLSSIIQHKIYTYNT
jgi:hypothetical protein